MKLSRRIIPRLAELICGAHGSGGFVHPNFPYRSSWHLTQFFREDCRLPYEHDGSTRISWVNGVLAELNNGYVSDPDLPSDGLITVLIELLTSVELDKPENHEGALEDVNRLLAKDNLQVNYFHGKHEITRLDKIIKTIQPKELNQALEDFIHYISSEMRKAFWLIDSDSKKYKWISSPERHAQNYLLTFLNGRFGESVYTFEEINAGAGRVDIYIALPKGEKIIVELKMCGHGYSESYAKDGLEQLAHYMENKNTEIGYLIVFDSRVRDFKVGLNTIELINGFEVLVRVADLRPYVKTKDAPIDV